MIIVSQDKDIILNLDNVSSIVIDDGETNKKIFANCNNDDLVELGEYESEERAKEVLLNISIQYSLNKMTQSINFKPNNENGASRYMPIYEMPEK